MSALHGANTFFAEIRKRNIVAQVFSSYESRHAREDKPFQRGMNSIQPINDGKGWWVLSILWDEERPDNPLPPDFASER